MLESTLAHSEYDSATLHAQSPSCLSQRYWLHKSVYACSTPDGVILLDLKRDDYIGIRGADANVLADLVFGWPGNQRGAGQHRTSSEECDRLLESMMREGLITLDAQSGRPATPAAVDPISLTPCSQDTNERRITARDLITFLVACATAAVELWVLPFERVVWNAQNRTATAPTADISCELLELVNVFARLRSYSYTAKDHCLFHALALKTFLARYGFSVQWVIGVSSAPFSAHSWVQVKDVVLDDSPEEVCSFTPILAV